MNQAAAGMQNALGGMAQKAQTAVTQAASQAAAQAAAKEVEKQFSNMFAGGRRH